MLKTAYVFPGQGSQAKGMLSDIVEHYPETQETLQEASDILGYDMEQLWTHDAHHQLDQTEFTQPALLTASYALWKVLHKNAAPAQVLAGHSLGEYSALVCANAISFADGLKLVAKRGQLMQAAVSAGEGAMAAIVGLTNENVQALCEERVFPGDVLVPANYNAPGQVVIAGHRRSVEAAVSVAKEKGAKLAVILPVSVPSHCALMKAAAQELAQYIEQLSIAMPSIPVIQNTNAATSQDVTAIRQALIAQLYSPVRWVESVQLFSQYEIEQVIEVGPGSVLTGLIKRISPTFSLKNTKNLQAFNEVLMQGVTP